jgi:hypothetical protein
LVFAPGRSAIQEQFHFAFVGEFVARGNHRQIPGHAIFANAIDFKITAAFQNIIGAIALMLAKRGVNSIFNFQQNELRFIGYFFNWEYFSFMSDLIKTVIFWLFNYKHIFIIF